ncbi:MAG TPA: Gfo/Idh/MocA family oxidoreductase [Gemmatales bacterium]|nr:Gfo/Idh/MocA family oxidoreductase [Gemmatales bacterium]
MPPPVRFGILGVAKINDRLIPAFGQSERAQLVAIASRARDRAEAAARERGIPKAHGSYEELLADPEVDAVYIPLPNHMHGEWTLKAADAGKHVLCEKPLALTAAQAQHMADHCRAREVRLMDGFMWPHHERTARLRQTLDAGTIGDVVRLTTCFTFPLPLETDNIRLHPEWGGGSLYDVGCYPVYLARWLFRSEPIRVQAVAEFHRAGKSQAPGVDLRMDVLLEFSEGRTALFDCGFTLPYRTQAEIVGTRGSIQIPRMWLPLPEADFFIHHGDDRVERVVVTGCDQIVAMLNEFATAIQERREPRPSSDEGVATMHALETILAAARDHG